MGGGETVRGTVQTYLLTGLAQHPTLLFVSQFPVCSLAGLGAVCGSLARSAAVWGKKWKKRGREGWAGGDLEGW